MILIESNIPIPAIHHTGSKSQIRKDIRINMAIMKVGDSFLIPSSEKLKFYEENNLRIDKEYVSRGEGGNRRIWRTK